MAAASRNGQPLSRTLRGWRFRSRRMRRPLVWVRHRGLHRDDSLLSSYPRSGTTWLRFLLTEALVGKDTGFELVGETVRYVGDHRHAPPLLPGDGRLIFSHEPFETTDHKIVYAVRDPRSVLLSEFRWLLRRRLYPEDFSAFFKDFLAGRTNPWGSWASHVTYWLTSPSASAGRLHVVRYEDLRAETPESLRRILAFLGAEPPDEVIQAAVRNNSLDQMRAKEENAPNRAFSKGVARDIRFVNSGATQGWKDSLTDRQVERLQDSFGEVMKRLGYER